MAVRLVMPRIGFNMTEGTVRRLLKRVGESVAANEVVCEIETEKVLHEVAAPAAGVIAALTCEEGQSIECGGTLAIIAEPNEDPAQAAGSDFRARPADEKPPDRAPAAAAPQTRPNARRPVTPIARKLAEELGVDLDSVIGTGPGGRVTREDVERAAAEQRAHPQQTSAETPAPAATDSLPFTGMRRTIAERMTASLANSAQLTLTVEADVTAAAEMRAQRGVDPRFTFSDMMIHAAARALRRHPRLNSRLVGERIELVSEVNLGLAVALTEGLVVPVIRNADQKSLSQIAAESSALGEKARAGRLTAQEMAGATFTITNLGTYGVDAFTPIINPGEAAILGMGRIAERPAIYRGEVARRSLMVLSLTFDHRLLDGAPAALFLRTVIELFNYGDR